MRCRLVKTLESPLDSKEMKSVNPKGNQSWIFIGRIAAEAETPILWPPNSKNWLIGKDLDTRKDWRQEEKGMTENEMVGWHHWLNGYEFEQAPGVGHGRRSLACCSPWGCAESWTVKKAECWRIDAFELWCWRRLLNCGVGEDSWDTFRQQRDPTSKS